jgi:hypothetical protein
MRLRMMKMTITIPMFELALETLAKRIYLLSSVYILGLGPGSLDDAGHCVAMQTNTIPACASSGA